MEGKMSRSDHFLSAPTASPGKRLIMMSWLGMDQKRSGKGRDEADMKTIPCLSGKLVWMWFLRQQSQGSTLSKKEAYLKALSCLLCLLLYFGRGHTCHMACGVLVPRGGTEPRPPAVKAWSPNDWTSRDVPSPISLYIYYKRLNAVEKWPEHWGINQVKYIPCPGY